MLKIPSNCTGCSACISICPKGCISESYNKEGFLYPYIDSEGCVNCGLCEKVCPVTHHKESDHSPKVLCGQNPDTAVVNQSSSGGIFTQIANHILDQDGVVYGVAIDYYDDCKIKHIRIDSEIEIEKLQGSKYVQSYLGDIFKYIKKDLDADRQVLFSGTPCQIAGLINYLGKEYHNLLTLDVICHGVPSPLIFEKYLSEFKSNVDKSENRDVSVTNISFRDKTKDWINYGFSITYTTIVDGESRSESILYDRYDNPYTKGFLENLFLRKSCHECPVKGFQSGSDITLGDAWGIENFINTEQISNGFSIAIPHTPKGLNILKALDVSWEEIPDDILKKHNPAAYKSCKPHARRNKFFKLIDSGKTIADAVNICLPPPTYLDKLKWSINSRITKLIKK